MRRITHFIHGTDTYPVENVQDQQDNFANIVPRTRRILFADGGFDEFGQSSAPAEVGNLQAQIVLRVTTKSDMTAKVDNLRKLSRDGKGFLFMEVEDGTTRWCRARVNNISTPVSEKTHSDYIIRAQVAFQVNDPHWYVTNTEDPAWGEFTWGDFTYGGTATANVVAGTSTDFVVTAGGKVKTLPRIVIACGTGETAQNITVKRLVDGSAVDEFVFTDTLIANDDVEVDCKARSVTKNGSDDYSSFSYSGHPDWLRLLPGDNDIRVTMANGGDDASVTFYFDDVYV